jgi:hypothetical protein
MENQLKARTKERRIRHHTVTVTAVGSRSGTIHAAGCRRAAEKLRFPEH